MGRMPQQKPTKSVQDYGTPWEFIRAVERRFGPIVCDLAAHEGNAKASAYYTPADDSLSRPWAEAFPRGLLWLNPPFKKIEPWAAKCALEGPRREGLIVMLTPASVGTAWFFDHVHERARVEPISPRLVFDGVPPGRDGRPQGFPKDLMLSIFGRACGGFARWRWKAEAPDA